LLADVPYPLRKYQQMGLKAGQVFWYRAQLVDRTGNESGYTDWVRGQASVDVSDITDAVLEQIKDTELFKDLIENAVESSEKVAELAEAVSQNADQLAAAVGANRQTAEAIIGNALAIADVVVRQSAQNGANSATFTQLREVIATETQARVTDVTRLEAKTDQNAAQVTQLTQALADETQARDGGHATDGARQSGRDGGAEYRCHHTGRLSPRWTALCHPVRRTVRENG
jgi:predicted phage tail protein